MSTIPIMCEEDVEQRARHEGAAKALRYMAEEFDRDAKRTRNAAYATVAVVLRQRAEYHYEALSIVGPLKPDEADVDKALTRGEEAVALVKHLARVKAVGDMSNCRADARCLVEKWGKADGK